MNKIIGDRGRSKYDPNLAREINKKVEDQERQERLKQKILNEETKESLEKKLEPVELENVLITPSYDSWLIENDKYKIRLSKSLIPSARQEKQINNYNTNLSLFKPASYPEIFFIGSMLRHNNSPHKDEVLKFLRESFDNSLIQTSSGIDYSLRGEDKINHNIGLIPSGYYHLIDLVGSSGEVAQTDERALMYLTGLNNLDEVKEISQFLTNKNKTFLVRVDLKQDIYKVAGLYTVSDEAGLDCELDPDDTYPALGVRVINL